MQGKSHVQNEYNTEAKSLSPFLSCLIQHHGWPVGRHHANWEIVKEKVIDDLSVAFVPPLSGFFISETIRVKHLIAKKITDLQLESQAWNCTHSPFLTLRDSRRTLDILRAATGRTLTLDGRHLFRVGQHRTDSEWGAISTRVSLCARPGQCRPSRLVHDNPRDTLLSEGRRVIATVLDNVTRVIMGHLCFQKSSRKVNSIAEVSRSISHNIFISGYIHFVKASRSVLITACKTAIAHK
ncbi:hypothetical protein J6590_056697 [Homalodisca vitripennis]|nr:hypothetical protein J6590_056697 [Homalodisca vitripennis]